jgi:hypothetical protein
MVHIVLVIHLRVVVDMFVLKETIRVVQIVIVMMEVLLVPLKKGMLK